MKVNQISGVLNDTIMKEITGQLPEGAETPIVKEDLSNIVDVGKTVLDFTGQNKDNFNNFITTLIDRIGRVQFVDRTYKSTAPSIVYDSWEYGSIMMKTRCEVPDFRDNVSWKLGDIFDDAATNSKVPGITDYKELDPFVLSLPNSRAKFYNSKITYECPITIAEMQLKSAFTSASQMGSFISMIENRIQMKMTLSTDALVMRTINNLIGLKINAGENVVNLLAEYNTEAGTTLTPEQALRNTEFLRYATKTIALYKDYLKTAGTLYNSGNYITFTPEDRLKFVVLSEFAKDMETYLYADTYHNEFVKMDGYSTVPFWQGTGTDGDTTDFKNRSTIHVEVSDDTQQSGKKEVNQTGVIGVMFDRDACAVCNENYRVTSQYNPRGEYLNTFYKYDSSYMNDVEENCIVFIVAETE